MNNCLLAGALLTLMASWASAQDLDLHDNSFVLEGGKVGVGVWPYTHNISDVTFTGRLTNRSGMGLNVALKGESSSIESCAGSERVTGVDVVGRDDMDKLQRQAAI